jgi:hypothetical protein
MRSLYAGDSGDALDPPLWIVPNQTLSLTHTLASRENWLSHSLALRSQV